MPVRRLALVALIIAPTFTGIAHAQAVTGLGDDATTPSAATVRVRIESGWSYWDQEYVSTDVNGGNRLQPLGARFTLDSLGASQLPILAPTRDSIRSLASSSTLGLTLGSSRAQVTQRINVIPIGVEAGITNWLAIGATLPIVRARSNVFFSVNTGGTQGNVGFEDATTVNADTAFAGSIVRSAAAVASYCAGAGSGSSQCAGYATQVAGAQSFGTTAAFVYGPSTNGVHVIPLQNSAAQTAINARAAAFAAYLNAFAGISASGVPAVAGSGLTGSVTPFATADAQTLISSSTGLAPLGTVTHTGIGDVEAVAKVKLLDTFGGETGRFGAQGVNARIAVAGGYRFPTGKLGSPDALYAIPTGTHAGAILLRGYTDIGIGSHFWFSAVGRMAKSRSDSVTFRNAPNTLFPDATTRVTLQRQLGTAIDVEATPRWVFNDFLSLGAQYQYRHRTSDTYADATGTAGVGFETGDYTEQRVGGGIVFSSTHAVQLRRTRIPFDVSYLHSETIAGRGGAPKLISDQIMARFYYRPHR